MVREIVRIDNPYGPLTSGQWLCGNLHTHTNQSDGERHPQSAIDDYARRGYDFLMISDHDVYTSEEACREFDARGMVLIPGNEITAGGPHLLHVNPDRLLKAHPQRQRILTEAQRSTGFLIVCHPNFQASFDHCTIEQMIEWDGYAGLEIYNAVIGRLEGSPYALDKWDILLSKGRRLWGFANDDCHREQGDVGLGWNVVYAPDRTLKSIVGAMAMGRFYASTGVVITDIRVEDTRIRVETRNAHRIVALQQWARRFAVADEGALEVSVPADATYVRFECYGSGETLACTQPIFIVRE